VFTFGPGVALPTRMRFRTLPPDLRPNSEASGNTRSDAGTTMSRDLISSVIDRWRAATMSHRVGEDDLDYGSTLDAPALQPAMPAAPPAPVPVPPSPRGEALRSSLLKKPLEAGTFGGPSPNKPSFAPPPPRFR
jgi:hypothetical protein